MVGSVVVGWVGDGVRVGGGWGGVGGGVDGGVGGVHSVEVGGW